MGISDKNKDVTVLGAGIIGTCCALSLLERGYNVTVIDKSVPGAETSYGNAGVISPWSCVPQCLPGTLQQIPGFLFKPESPMSFRWRDLPKTLPWVLKFLSNTKLDRVEKIADAMDQLMQSNVAMYKRYLVGTGHENLLEDSWYLNVFRGEKHPDLQDLPWKLRIDRGAPIEIISGDELRELEPAISRDYHSAVIIKDQSRTTSPGKLCSVLAEKARSLGAVFVRDELLQISPKDNGSFQLHCKTQSIAAEKVILAAGIWSADLLRPLGIKVPLIAERGYHLEFSDPNVTLKHSIADVAGKFVVSSMQGGLRAAGTAEFARHDAPPNFKRAQMLAPQTKALLPDLNIDPAKEWMGSRPSFPDNLPAIGEISEFPGLFAAFGHSHYGMGMAPATGRLIASIVDGQTPNSNMEPFNVSRFS